MAWLVVSRRIYYFGNLTGLIIRKDPDPLPPWHCASLRCSKGASFNSRQPLLFGPVFARQFEDCSVGCPRRRDMVYGYTGPNEAIPGRTAIYSK